MQHLPVHPILRHPRTGQPLVAVGIVNGRPVWPIMGASSPAGEGQGQQGGQQAGQQGGASGGQTGSDQGGTGQQGGQQTGQTGGQQQGQQGEPQDVSSLPKWAQDLIKEIRGEAASNRTKATQLEKASQQQLDAIAKALGLKPADADPAKLAEELAKAQATARTTQVELAVHRTAAKHGADADALLDSRSFLAAVAELDPAAADFGAKVEAAIKDAVKTNPKLKAATTAGRSSGDGPPGGGGTGKRPGLGAAIANAYKT